MLSQGYRGPSCLTGARLRPGTRLRPGNEDGDRRRLDGGRPGSRSRAIGRPYRGGHDLVIGGQMTDRIGARRIAGQLERLAAAATEIELAAVTATAGFRHPARATEALEDGGMCPDPGQGMLTGR